MFIHYDLKLNFIEISLNNKIKELDFLDVNHIMNEKEKVGFYVKPHYFTARIFFCN